MAPFPNAPQLPPAALREIFTYPDPSRAPGDDHNPYSDVRRLEFLGQKMAEAAYLDVMMRTNAVSHLDVQTIERRIHASFAGFAEKTARAYGWSLSVRGFPANVDRNTPEELRRIFYTYAGAVCVPQPGGYYNLREWIKALVEFGV
ncbi:hypothetical protein FKP32DRAFT_1678746 [Trametes sanguinea]|nr:hypothetical protein FKP32DRAFT_1678746 [Trametes sanguinea]